MLFNEDIKNERQKLIQESEKYINFFTREDLTKLKKINAGTDATIYKINNRLSLKLYNTTNQIFLQSSENEVLKTVKPQKFVNNFKFQSNCFDEYGVRLGYDSIIKIAQEKQKYINLTYLPLNPCYIDGFFRGCFLKKFSNYLPISCFEFLPERKKLEIIYKLLPKFKELIDNYVYPTDIYNKLDYTLPHNNIIVSIFNLNPQIIDLDGKSVAYSFKENSEYLHQTTFGIITFILEFLYNQDLIEYFDEYEIYVDYYKDFFASKGMPDYFIDKLLNNNVDFESIENFIDYKRKKYNYLKLY